MEDSTVDKLYIEKPTGKKSSPDKSRNVDKLNINVIRQVLAVTLTQLFVKGGGFWDLFKDI